MIKEGTGKLNLGPCGMYIRQRGRCQAEVEVIGKSCHGSMSSMRINPLEHGAKIITDDTEAAKVVNVLGRTCSFGTSIFIKYKFITYYHVCNVRKLRMTYT